MSFLSLTKQWDDCALYAFDCSHRRHSKQLAPNKGAKWRWMCRFSIPTRAPPAFPFCCNGMQLCHQPQRQRRQVWAWPNMAFRCARARQTQLLTKTTRYCDIALLKFTDVFRKHEIASKIPTQSTHYSNYFLSILFNIVISIKIISKWPYSTHCLLTTLCAG